MSRTIRCPFCVTLLPTKSLIGRVLGLGIGRETCPRCGRPFKRSLGEQVGHIYDHIVEDFEERLAEELKTLQICDRAEVLMQFGLKMDNAKVAAVEMLMRSLSQLLEPQFAGLARGSEGGVNIRRVSRGACACVDIDAVISGGTHSRRRLRIARIDGNGFIQADLDQSDRIVTKQIAR